MKADIIQVYMYYALFAIVWSYLLSIVVLK